jgi:aminoglycoside/choline kinase family phosphotransferase
VILRDYHAQNLLWMPERAGIAAVGQLDFQDALLGHPAYDLVSILQDARRDVDPAIEIEMIDLYLSKTDLDRDDFLRSYAILGAQRNLCILGIFARLARRDGKPHYVDLIPRVWDYVQRNLKHPALVPLAKTLNLPEPTAAFLQSLKDA